MYENVLQSFFLFWKGGGVLQITGDVHRIAQRLIKGAILRWTMITTTAQYFKYESWSCIYALLLPECQSTDNSLLQEPKIYTFLCIVGTKRPKLCEMPLVSRFVWGVGQSARVGLLALFAFPATLVGPPNQKLRRLQSTKTPHFQHICPGVWGDTSTQYATVINKKLCELCYMSAISSGKFHWIYRALLNLPH